MSSASTVFGHSGPVSSAAFTAVTTDSLQYSSFAGGAISIPVHTVMRHKAPAAAVAATNYPIGTITVPSTYDSATVFLTEVQVPSAGYFAGVAGTTPQAQVLRFTQGTGTPVTIAVAATSIVFGGTGVTALAHGAGANQVRIPTGTVAVSYFQTDLGTPVQALGASTNNFIDFHLMIKYNVKPQQAV